MTTQTKTDTFDAIEDLAEGIAWLDSDSLWELTKYLNKHHPMAANLLKADLEFSQSDDIAA
jgi:hypothetical protein